MNEPGKPTLQYRVDTHAGFMAAMVEQLRQQSGLRLLAAPDTSDPTMALLDAWATTLEVLSFYQERIANEGFLRTATERQSLRELGRMVGYALNPGVAAETYLAFTVDDSPGAAEVVQVDPGTRVQSVPGPGEQAQIFESVESLAARPAWNALHLEKTQSSALVHTSRPVDTYVLYVQGASSGIKPGDGLLMQPETSRNSATFGRVTDVTPEPAQGRTALTLDPGVSWPTEPSCVYAFHLRAALFGHNAPDWIAMPASIQAAYCASSQQDPTTATDWPGFTVRDTAPAGAIQLDGVYPQLCSRPGAWLVLADARHSAGSVRTIRKATESACANFTLASSTTCVYLSPGNLEFDLRQTVVFADSYQLQLARAPLTDALARDASSLTLDGRVDDLYVGQTVILEGLPPGASQDSHPIAQCIILTGIHTHAASGHTVLEFTPALATALARDSVTIYANVVRATHGESVAGVLGSGDGATAFAHFTLRQGPLTYVPAPTASGGENSLCVLVNDIEWTAVRSLAASSPGDRVYSVETDADGGAVVQFGNGITGARLPSGDENVSARYRIGVGLGGNVRPDQVRVLLAYPVGVRGVTNPLCGTSGADPEDVPTARQNLPRSVYTLDRAVTLRDYAEFARGFGGIGRAHADWLWDGVRGIVVISVVGPDGKQVVESTIQRLVDALDAARDPAQHVLVLAGRTHRFGVTTRIVLEPGRVPAAVRAAAAARLRTTFAFPQRDFGQDLNESAILDSLQTVPGVCAARLVSLSDPAWSSADGRLTARLASVDANGQIAPAEILLLDDAQDAVVVRDVADLSQAEDASA